MNKLLLGDRETTFNVISGDISNIKIKYVITLDADTKLPIDGAKRLIGTISHPLNVAVLNEEKNVVEEGYGIVQPRISVDIESSAINSSSSMSLNSVVLFSSGKKSR